MIKLTLILFGLYILVGPNLLALSEQECLNGFNDRLEELAKQSDSEFNNFLRRHADIAFHRVSRAFLHYQDMRDDLGEVDQSGLNLADLTAMDDFYQYITDRTNTFDEHLPTAYTRYDQERFDKAMAEMLQISQAKEAEGSIYRMQPSDIFVLKSLLSENTRNYQRMAGSGSGATRMYDNLLGSMNTVFRQRNFAQADLEANRGYMDYLNGSYIRARDAFVAKMRREVEEYVGQFPECRRYLDEIKAMTSQDMINCTADCDTKALLNGIFSTTAADLMGPLLELASGPLSATSSSLRVRALGTTSKSCLAETQDDGSYLVSINLELSHLPDHVTGQKWYASYQNGTSSCAPTADNIDVTSLPSESRVHHQYIEGAIGRPIQQENEFLLVNDEKNPLTNNIITFHCPKDSYNIASAHQITLTNSWNTRKQYLPITCEIAVPEVVPTPIPTVAPTPTPDLVLIVVDVDPIPTPVPTVAPTPTPVPTVAPTPTPVPTVAPTPIPELTCQDLEDYNTSPEITTASLMAEGHASCLTKVSEINRKVITAVSIHTPSIAPTAGEDEYSSAYRTRIQQRQRTVNLKAHQLMQQCGFTCQIDCPAASQQYWEENSTIATMTACEPAWQSFVANQNYSSQELTALEGCNPCPTCDLFSNIMTELNYTGEYQTQEGYSKEACTGQIETKVNAILLEHNMNNQLAADVIGSCTLSCLEAVPPGSTEISCEHEEIKPLLDSFDAIHASNDKTACLQALDELKANLQGKITELNTGAPQIVINLEPDQACQKSCDDIDEPQPLPALNCQHETIVAAIATFTANKETDCSAALDALKSSIASVKASAAEGQTVELADGETCGQECAEGPIEGPVEAVDCEAIEKEFSDKIEDETVLCSSLKLDYESQYPDCSFTCPEGSDEDEPEDEEEEEEEEKPAQNSGQPMYQQVPQFQPIRFRGSGILEGFF